MKKGITIGIIIAAVVIGLGLASPLFYDVEVNESLPVALDNMQKGLTLEKFVEMDDESRVVLVDAMPEKVKEMIMDESAKKQSVTNEEMDTTNEIKILKSGEFIGLAGHFAEGDAKILQVGEEQFLRFENFEVTNGPDLRVYMTQGGDVKQGIHLEKLKGSKGAQNYLLENIDTDVYDTVVIYCQPFEVYFGEAQLVI
ncbi:MAG: DM13 domain-containing protein [Nitrosopumilaceae archaeon]|nr:DM13 domain-containing protein [Nitrosopumilaceae archaeon]